MMSDKMREEFEAAVTLAFHQAGSIADLTKVRGQYVEDVHQSAWWAWQASRSAVVIDKPEDFTDGGSPNARILIAHHREIVGRWVNSIEAAGLKVNS